LYNIVQYCIQYIVDRFFGLYALGEVVRATASMEPPLTSREKKTQRSCFTIANGKLHPPDRDDVLSDKSPRFGRVMSWLRLGKWKSEGHIWLAQVQLFTHVGIEAMTQRMHRVDAGPYTPTSNTYIIVCVQNAREVTHRGSFQQFDLCMFMTTG
jgi:hypothetical protein